jgi:hypothetical protein
MEEALSEDNVRWLVSRFAHLMAAHGEVIGRPDLVLPTGEFFPDEFTLDPEGVMRVSKRLLSYAPVSADIPVGLAFLEEGEKAGGGGGCGTGACGTGGGAGKGAEGGTLLETEDGYGITLAVADTGNPVLMTTALARGTGALVLSEAGEEVSPEDLDALSEIAASVIGFGVLLTCGAYVYGKSCGGVRMRQATHLTVAEHAHLLALFCRLHDHKPGRARGQLETTAKEAFDTALAWVDSNPQILEALRAHPETLADGVFPVEAPKGFFGRLFTRKPSSGPEELPMPKKRTQRTEAEERRLREARALVEEALAPVAGQGRTISE